MSLHCGSPQAMAVLHRKKYNSPSEDKLKLWKGASSQGDARKTSVYRARSKFVRAKRSAETEEIWLYILRDAIAMRCIMCNGFGKYAIPTYCYLHKVLILTINK